MNYLELINRLRRECGVSGPALANLDTLSAESRRMADWIADAWVDIQQVHDDWQFMRKHATFNLVPGQQEYTASDLSMSDLANWKPDSFTCSSDGQAFADEQIMTFLEYEGFRRMYMFGPARTRHARPVFMTITPDKSLSFGPGPDRNYVITADYYAKPVRLSVPTDIPSIDEQHHLMIVFKAMMAYGTFEAATEVFGRGEIEYKRMLRDLEIDRLPMLTNGPPLA